MIEGRYCLKRIIIDIFILCFKKYFHSFIQSAVFTGRVAAKTTACTFCVWLWNWLIDVFFKLDPFSEVNAMFSPKFVRVIHRSLIRELFTIPRREHRKQDFRATTNRKCHHVRSSCEMPMNSMENNPELYSAVRNTKYTNWVVSIVATDMINVCSQTRRTVTTQLHTNTQQAWLIQRTITTRPTLVV